MKLLYGIQGTGNGHLTRARVMAPQLKKAGIDVDYIVTGRPRDKLFDMEPFGDFRCYEGFTFITANGNINYLKTALSNNISRFFSDIKTLNVDDYDLVITDFEPVSAWAARRHKNKPLMGIGHQYAFPYKIPVTGDNPVAKTIMRNFAPAKMSIGLHWHHFNQPILPPVIDLPSVPQFIEPNKIIVYLPFENSDTVVQLLAQYKTHRFFLYTAEQPVTQADNVTVKPLSRDGFQKDLYNSAGVICNAGFELASEALQMGKKILVKPLHGQMEQLSNALALAKLEYAEMMHTLEPKTIERWLQQDHAIRINYPDTAAAIVKWIHQGDWKIDQAWIDSVWQNCHIEKVDIAQVRPKPIVVEQQPALLNESFS